MKQAFLPTALSALVLVGCSLGGKAADFTVSSSDDAKQVSLSSLQGKVVLVDFWATWCGPCRETIPTIQKLYDDYKDKGVQFMGISDETQAKVTQFRNENQVTYPMFLDPNDETEHAYGIEGIPHLFIIDKKGHIAEDEIGAPVNEGKLRSTLDKCLANSG